MLLHLGQLDPQLVILFGVSLLKSLVAHVVSGVDRWGGAVAGPLIDNAAGGAGGLGQILAAAGRGRGRPEERWATPQGEAPDAQTCTLFVLNLCVRHNVS